MACGGTMESKRRDPVKLPLEIFERALSLLSVPELCRMRCVCKAWNEIVSRPSFHDLCDVNGRGDEYLFVWSRDIRREPLRLVVNPVFSDTFSFLDVDAKRWYSIPAANLDVESRFMAMSDGLVCELTSVKGCADNNFALAISDPVAKTRRSLPSPPQGFNEPGSNHVSGTQIVAAVDNATNSYKVFLTNSLSFPFIPSLRAQPRVYVYESFTNEWQALRDLPNGVGVEYMWASSALILHESLFVLKQHVDRDFKYRLSLFRYIFREGTWAEVYQMYFARRLVSNPTLVARSDRLYLTLWLGRIRSSDPNFNPHFSDPGLKSDLDCLEPVAFSEHPNYPDTDFCFEMYEILIDEYRRKLVVQLPCAQLQQLFGRDGSEVDGIELDVKYSFPSVDSNGICKSVILVRTSSSVGFELWRYELATGSVDILPPHPLVEPSNAELASHESIGEYFSVKNMKLSLRNVLAQRLKFTSTGWRLLQ